MKYTLTSPDESTRLQTSTLAPVIAWNPTACDWCDRQRGQQAIIFLLERIRKQMMYSKPLRSHIEQ